MVAGFAKVLEREETLLQKPDVNQRLLGKELNALSSALIALKKCVLGPHGPRIAVKAVQEAVVNLLQRNVAPDEEAAQFARALANRAGSHCHEIVLDSPLESYSCRGRVAQLGEHLLCKQGVAGSIPATSTNPLGLQGAYGTRWSRNLQEDVTNLSRAWISRPASLRGFPQSHALERIHKWRGRGLPSSQMAVLQMLLDPDEK